MIEQFQLMYPYVLYFGMIGVAAIGWYVLWHKKGLRYRYSLVTQLANDRVSRSWGRTMLHLLRMMALFSLLIVLARPVLVDSNSKVQVEGIDIMMVLDVSNSMMLFDDLRDRRPRIAVAKEEAIKFVEKRTNDQVGLVIFGRDAVSRCPLTFDKKIVTDIIGKLELGVINADGTVLAQSIVTAANRLKASKAKSKIMILLTDGEPTPELDVDPRGAVEIAQQLGIKIYTIGIGGEHGGLLEDPLFGVRSMGFQLNTKLLKAISQATGGVFFEAKRPDDLEKIYATIDQLEKTEYETTHYQNYYDIFIPFLVAALVVLIIELLAATFVWFAL